MRHVACMGRTEIDAGFIWGNTVVREGVEHLDMLTYLITDLLTYLLTPWSSVLLEKLTGFQLVKKVPEFASAHNLSLS